MQARETESTRRAGRRYAALMHSQCGKPAAVRRCLAQSHDSWWAVLLVEHQCVAQSWPSRSRWQRALGNQQSGRSGNGRARAGSRCEDGEREGRFTAKVTMRCEVVRAVLAAAHAVMVCHAPERLGSKCRKLRLAAMPEGVIHDRPAWCLDSGSNLLASITPCSVVP